MMVKAVMCTVSAMSSVVSMPIAPMCCCRCR